MHDDSEAAIDALMARLARGDRSAFDALFRALHPRALRLARARLDPALADDAAQSALLKLFARAHTFLPNRPALPWFYAIVANEIRATRRGTRPHAELDPQGPESVREENHEDQLLARELLQAFEQAVAALDDDAAQAIRAVLGRGPAPVLQPATFRKRVSRAYARLRLLLGELR